MILRGTLALAARGRLSTLIFHRVLARRDPLLAEEPTAEEFDALLAHLARTYHVLPLADAVRRLYTRSLPASALAITFDDGYADNLHVAARLLVRHRLPATVFIATGYLDGGVMWNDIVIAAFRTARSSPFDLRHLGLGTHALDTIAARRVAMNDVLDRLKYRSGAQREHDARAVLAAAGGDVPRDLMLTTEEARALCEHGIDVGAHTVRHPILAGMQHGEAWQEICESKRALETIVGHRVTTFAYPNGRPGRDYNDEHVRMVREAGFEAAVTTGSGAASRATDPLQVPRFTPWTRQPVKFDLLMLRNLRQEKRREIAPSG